MIGENEHLDSQIDSGLYQATTHGGRLAVTCTSGYGPRCRRGRSSGAHLFALVASLVSVWKFLPGRPERLLFRLGAVCENEGAMVLKTFLDAYGQRASALLDQHTRNLEGCFAVFIFQTYKSESRPQVLLSSIVHGTRCQQPAQTMQWTTYRTHAEPLYLRGRKAWVCRLHV